MRYEKKIIGRRSSSPEGFLGSPPQNTFEISFVRIDLTHVRMARGSQHLRYDTQHLRYDASLRAMLGKQSCGQQVG